MKKSITLAVAILTILPVTTALGQSLLALLGSGASLSAGTCPGGSANSIQYNNSSNCGGFAAWDGTTINFDVSKGLSFAGSFNPITVVGGDDGFGDSAIVFDDADDGFIALKFNQSTYIALADNGDASGPSLNFNPPSSSTSAGQFGFFSGSVGTMGGGGAGSGIVTPATDTAGATYQITSGSFPAVPADTRSSITLNGALDGIPGTISIVGITNLDSLKTTGSATGKNIVCVDTSTGILYASSSGAACLN